MCACVCLYQLLTVGVINYLLYSEGFRDVARFSEINCYTPVCNALLPLRSLGIRWPLIDVRISVRMISSWDPRSTLSNKTAQIKWQCNSTWHKAGRQKCIIVGHNFHILTHDCLIACRHREVWLASHLSSSSPKTCVQGMTRYEKEATNHQLTPFLRGELTC